MTKIAVFGARGFVGASVVRALGQRHTAVVQVRAPRHVERSPSMREELAAQLLGVDGIVNCAGIPDAAAVENAGLRAANVELPAFLADVASELAVRFVHVSSAAVQGRVRTLDDSPTTQPFSAYSLSKADGERAALTHSDHTVVYRPPGVHHESRRVTQYLAKLASSPASSVAGVGDRPSAQALLENVGDAVAFLAVSEASPPSIVHHPSEGVTTRSILEDLGDRVPRSLPVPVAAAAVRSAYLAGRLRPSLLGHARRIEMLWFGQDQAPSWLTTAGWTPVLGRERWHQIGTTIRHPHSTDKEHVA